MKRFVFLFSCLFALNAPATFASNDGGGEGSGRFQKMIEDHRERQAERELNKSRRDGAE